jgi:PAS domain S-box-containing protein
VRSPSLQTKIVALTACAVLGTTALTALAGVLLWRDHARGLLEGAPERLEALWEADARRLAVQAWALAADPKVTALAAPDADTNADPAPLADAFAARAGRAPDPARDLLAVTTGAGAVRAAAGHEAGALARALGGLPGRGLRLLDGTPFAYAVAPFSGPGGLNGAVLVARRVDPARLAAWAGVAGGRVRFLPGTEPPPAAGTWPAPARAWRLGGDGPWVRVEAPLPADRATRGVLVLALAAGALGTVAAWVLARGVVRPLQAIEATARRVAAGEAPPPVALGAGEEIDAVARAVNRMRVSLDEHDQALRESAHRLKTLQEEAVDALFLFDRTGRVQDVNAKAVALTGFDRETLLARDVITCVEDDRGRQEAVYRHFMGCLEGTPAVFETRFATANGGSVPVEVSAGLIPHLHEPIVQAFVRDITERKRLEAQLADAEKMEGIGTLAGGIAHDFNNILGGVLGYASLIKGMVPEGDRLYRYTDIIERSAARAAELTQQLLGYARGGKYQVARVRLNDVIEEVAALLRQDLGERGITLDAQLDTHLPAAEADTSQIHQVLTNLCVNARDAMPEGGRLRIVSEAVDLEPGDPATPPGLSPGRYVRLTVADTGEGMSAEVQRRMFEPFFTTKPPGEGTGLGLAMVYGIVKNHGGQITVASRPGHGTAVRIYLPALEGTVQVLPREAPEVAGGRETVLVVDDEVTILELAREILTGKGYSVVLARDGEEAAHICEEYGESIALAVLDIVMPRMGGKETYKRLKGLNPNLKVIVSSGFSRHGQAHDLLEMGAEAFVQKPYKADDLAAVVRQTLDAPPKAMAQSA